MISVIISSVNKSMLAAVSQSIADTIGVPFEILGIDNSNGTYGICAVYNQGARQAQYDMLCFVHEDVEFKTLNWGQQVIRIFNADAQLGLLGVAGSTYKAAAPSGWHGAGILTDHVNILQGYKNTQELRHYYRNPDNKKLTEVVCIDGVWMCSPRAVALQIPFDEYTFTGFHAYDIDFSLSVGQHYKVAVTYEVLMHHFSEGNFDKKWVYEILKLYNKWHKHLPTQTQPLTSKDQLTAERETFYSFIAQAIKAEVPMVKVYQALWHCTIYRRKFQALFFKLNKHIYRLYKAVPNG
ncbi:glycosyltransferase [Mucilaginibacter terrae]|uniref:glycosyltransferase n=1 Tax=Mucilaginibacter terrae TaxID=1955052 RepID=UPI003641D185